MARKLLMLIVAVSSCLLTLVARADSAVQVTQVDPSRFPEITIYVSVNDENGQPKVGLTRDDFGLLEDGKPVEIKDFAGIGEARPVDIVFVIDTTSSMSDEIEGVKNTCIAFADKLRRANRDFRLGLITFGDEIRQVYGSRDTLTADVEEFKRWISQQAAAGGADSPEISLDGLERATQMSYRANTQKILILITDAPPHVRGDGTSFSRVEPGALTARLRDESYTVYAVAYDDARFRNLALETHGEFYLLQRNSDFTGIIDKIGGKIASQYRMTYLSARPSYDGTRRAIEVQVVGKRAEGTYLEEHLINVRSNPVIAMALLLPLLLALALPALLQLRTARRPAPAASAPGNERMPIPVNHPTPAGAILTPVTGGPTGGQAICPSCGNALRPGARFCSRCGKAIMPLSAPPIVAAPLACPRCGSALRSGARFCSVCGQNTGGGA